MGKSITEAVIEYFAKMEEGVRAKYSKLLEKFALNPQVLKERILERFRRAFDTEKNFASTLYADFDIDAVAD